MEQPFFNKVLLIFDTDSPNCQFVENLLSNKNYEILKTSDISSAKEIISNSEIGLIISDTDFANFSGIDILKFVNENNTFTKYPPPEVIFFSRYLNNENVIESLNNGARYYFVPPFNVEKIKKIIDYSLHIRMEKIKQMTDFQELSRMNAELKSENEKLKRTVKEFNIINQVAEILVSSISLNELLNKLLKKIVSLMEIDVGTILLVDEKDNDLILKASVGLSDDLLKLVRLKKGDNSLAGQVIEKKEPIIIHNIEDTDKQLQSTFLNSNCHSELGVPLKNKADRVIGALIIGSLKPNRFSECEIPLLEIISSYIALSIDNLKAYEAAIKEKEIISKEESEMTALYHLSRNLSSTIETNNVIEILISGVTEMIDCDACSLLLVDEDNQGDMYIRTFVDFSTECINKLKNRITSTWLTLSGKDVKIDSDQVVPFAKEGEERKFVSEIKSWLSAPFAIGNNLIGLISIVSSRPKAFDQGNLEILYIVSNLAARVIENAKLHEETKKLATMDGLTGLYNHRTFQEKLEAEFARSLRYHCALSLVLLDIDHFKQVNDTYGHQKGDMVLKQISACVKGAVRHLDSVCRYGGEEFAIILPETDIKSATVVAERIRKLVQEIDFSYLEPGKRLSVSLGVAMYPSDYKVNQRSELIEQADSALYKAKRSGRNQVVLYSKECNGH